MSHVAGVDRCGLGAALLGQAPQKQPHKVQDQQVMKGQGPSSIMFLCSITIAVQQSTYLYQAVKKERLRAAAIRC